MLDFNLKKGLWLGADSPERALDLWKKDKASGKMVISVGIQSKDEIFRFFERFA